MKIKNITKQMTDELNEKLLEQGCIFKFRFATYPTDSSIGVIYPEFVNDKFLHLNSIIVIDHDGTDFMCKFLKSKGIEWVSCTAAGGYIAYQDNDIYY